MEVIVNGEFVLAEMGLVRKITENSIIFSVKNEEVEIPVTEETRIAIQEIILDDENALFPIDLYKSEILLHAKVN